MLKRQYTSVDGRSIVYYKEGRGKQTLIMLPGLCADCNIWESVITRLRYRYTILAFCLPLYGTYNHHHERYTIATLAQLLRTLIVRFHIRKPVLIGHSLGGLVNLMYTGNHPRLVKKLICVSTPLSDHKEPLPLAWRLAVEMGRKLRKNEDIARWLQSQTEALDALVAIIMGKKRKKAHLNITESVPLKTLACCYEDLFHYPFDHLIRRIHPKPSILFVYGTLDQPFLKFAGTALYPSLDGAEIIPLVEGHFIPTAQPHKMATIIEDFVDIPTHHG